MSRIRPKGNLMGILDDISKTVKTVNKVSRTINSVSRAGKTVTNTVKKASKVVNDTTKTTSKSKSTSRSTSAKKTSTRTTKSSSSKTSDENTSNVEKKNPFEEIGKDTVQTKPKDVAYKTQIRLTEKSTGVTIESLPLDMNEFKSLPEAALSSPFDTAALTLLAFVSYQGRSEMALSMLQFLRGPAGLSDEMVSTIASEIEACAYAPRSYFVGALPTNDYTPSAPYTVEIYEGNDSYLEEGYANLYVKSSGAQDPRRIILRQAKSGEWYLWDQDVLDPVSEPDGGDVWV